MIDSIGLFHRAISLSGTTMARWPIQGYGKEYARTFAQHFNCSTQSSIEILDCLKTQDADDLTSASAMKINVNRVTVYMLLNAANSFLN